MAQNGILQYDKSTGLKVGTKAEIRKDLEDMWVTAYGGDMVVSEGTSTYTFIDLLSSVLADMGNAAKELYDSFTFATAGTYSYGKDTNGNDLIGAPLDMLCSLTGISRREGESDVELRYRYYASLYNQSVGTSEGLRSQILKLALNDYAITESTTNKFVVKDSYIYNNPDNTTKTVTYPLDVSKTITVPGHSIMPVIRIEVNNDLYTACTVNTLYKQEDSEVYDKNSNKSIINTCIADYKSLGCGLYNKPAAPYTNYDVGYCIIASPIRCKLKVTATTIIKDNVLSTTISGQVLTAIADTIQQQLDNYLEHFTLGQSLIFGDIARQCYIAIDKLNYSQYIINITDIGYAIYDTEPTYENDTDKTILYTSLKDGVKSIPYVHFIIPGKLAGETSAVTVNVTSST